MHTCRKILSGLKTSEGQRLEDLNTLSERDWARIRDWNQAVPATVDACVHQIFQELASANPDLPAVCSWDGDLTYHRLDRLSSKLAHHLRRLGVGPEVIVPFCFEKSMWAIIATMAVLKSGGAFAPLDPLHPTSRLESIVSSVGAKIVLVSPSYAHQLEGNMRTVVTISPSFLDSLEECEDGPVVNGGPKNAAFVLFTSGSTGQPKGIIQDHSAVCTMARTYKDALHINASSRVFQFAAYTFDVSTVDIYTTLMNGGCVCIPSEFDRKNNIICSMKRMQVNWANLTPSFARLLKPEDVPSLQTLVLAGEEVTQEHVARWSNKVRLINCYGPAESGGCIAHMYRNSQSQPGTIGRPLPFATCWIADTSRSDRLASVGAIGELVVEGPSLARGYLKDPERTRAAFIENPEWLPQSQSGFKRRIYRTGDLVYYRPDGSINFVGRKDTQVKVRGQRVELSETEHHLSTYPVVAKCVVTFPRFGQYAKRLVAVVQLRGAVLQSTMDDCLRLVSDIQLKKLDFSPSRVSDYMKKTIPAYMVPTAWIVVDCIPLSTSAKIDRRRVESWLASLNHSRDYPASLGLVGTENLLLIPDNNPVALEISAMAANLVADGNTRLRKALRGHDFSFSAVGIDSIQIITLSRLIERKFATKVDVAKLTRSDTTVLTLAEDIGQARESCFKQLSTPCVDVLNEVAALHSKFLSSYCKSKQGACIEASKVENVFLTGVTGFLGMHILKQLLRSADIKKIILHVRACSVNHGLQRVVGAARAANWWSEDFAPRLEIWTGDLAKPRIGLSDQQWKLLMGDAAAQDRVHAFIHNGSAVRWNADYNSLKRANVQSTLELLRALLGNAAGTRFVYISGGQRLSVGEEDDRASIDQITSSTGYAQTKLVSELLVKKVASGDGHIGCWMTVVKPSYIIGTTDEGIANVGDYIWRFVAGAIEIKAYNGDEANKWLFIADVDRVASAVLQSLFGDGNQQPNVVKILDRILVPDFWNIIKSDFGYDMKALDGPHWWRTLREHVEAKGEQHPLWPLSQLLESGKGDLGAPVEAPTDLPETMRARVKAAIKSNVKYLRKIGFLP